MSDRSSGGSDHVVLVDESDRDLGVAEKLTAHQRGGALHRAFSVFIFNAAGEMLIQRRAAGKYHFGGLWTNACCSHPRSGKDVAAEARIRLKQEFGIDVPLEKRFSFVYRAEDPTTGLTEHEFDHVLTGRFEGTPEPDSDEIGEWRWVEPGELLADVERYPERYTPWFKLVLQKVLKMA